MMKRVLSILKEPISPEMKSLLRSRWDELPRELQTDWQVVGQQLVHCGYTMGAPYCALGCTHCYLPRNANQAPTPSFEEMKAQVDANRRMIGPGGGLQITGGDVVDAYWRADRADELITIIRYANDAGVVPMLMTHGQILLENPEYLMRLVREGGLRKLAIHIDITQAGRHGYPIRTLTSESDLHPLREAFVDLILNVRQETGVSFFAAHTVTVTERNIGSIAEIVRWLIADPRHLDAFRMVSFQTEADVGRTRISMSPVTPEKTWEEICSGAGIDLPRDNLWFGHPDCSNMTSLMVLYPERRVVNLIPSDESSRAYWSAVLQVFGGVGSRGESLFESFLRKLTLLARHPSILWRTLGYTRYRLRQECLGPGVLWRLLRGRVRGFNIVLHNFMSAAEMAEPRSDVVEKRLVACSFRGAVRRDGKWVAVSMCEMNAEERTNLYAAQINAPSGRPAASSPQ